VKGARCAECKKEMDSVVLKESIKKGEVYVCSDESCLGPVKPGVILFGEQLPPDFFVKKDAIKTADLVIVMGTALAVAPFNSLIEMAPKHVPKVLINRENTKKYSGYDFEDTPGRNFLQGDCDDIVQKLIRDVGWEPMFKELLEQNKL